MTDICQSVAPARRLKWEFTLFFVLAPVLGAVLLPANYMFAMLFGMMLLGLILLSLTPGFSWGELTQGARAAAHPWLLLSFALGVFLLCYLVMRAFAPEAGFFLIRENPRLMLMIAVLYPLVSALPQEIIYRALYFRRYEAILPQGAAGLWLNGAVFSLAHLMYWSWLVLIMTLAGGLVFAWAYRVRHSFALALALHAVAGVILFAVGLGVFFYSGNVTRPF
ncbi:MAG: CPBP family glutamic-type intramembrane protease [Mangrovicoccus sp.]|nr:CPBP family glutamic-type intramembrane protease [Mangrovicoccus sp.]